MTSSTPFLCTTSEDERLSPPSSPFSEPTQPIISPSDLGMIDDHDGPSENDGSSPGVAFGAPRQKTKSPSKRQQITYVSRHFVKDRSKEKVPMKTANRKKRRLKQPKEDSSDIKPVPAPHPITPVQPQPRIYYGYNIDDFSSDSSLTDIPDDLDEAPDQFTPSNTPELIPDVETGEVKVSLKKVIRSPTKSPYFPHPPKHRPTFLSTLPFPPLAHKTFGLMQERLAHDPFRLLIATILLNKTPGERAMPIFYQLMNRFPTPSDLASAEVSDITNIIYVLGFQNQRARKCVEMARVWIERPPEFGKRYRKLNYPNRGDGRDVKEGDMIGDHDSRVAWEISHLPGLGPYSHDSWRMFCRDKLRGLSSSWNGEDSQDPNSFEPEWKRVVPLDKELRAYLTWVWMKEGWVWNKESGQRTRASDKLMAQAQGGGIVIEEKDRAHLVIKTAQDEDVGRLQDHGPVEHTAGDFLPSRLPATVNPTQGGTESWI
ncbi:uncharacterized protein A1O9_12025 [Exophiala aquamarina CBS 119918]|uniref:HhH-GPD domain-containing protein n=1 Tax=Exophiala aquamarina CBS 119918 TaxID=1182545 RepID=A0A072P8W6_9EURO|nr:uncharacterized protein A1O9_12025 [Exophiala aquamarina CBS 119918]KEF52035.1 hypothetical protein A1O9_12025 [Exophiala aquamarina CBS 119918]